MQDQIARPVETCSSLYRAYRCLHCINEHCGWCSIYHRIHQSPCYRIYHSILHGLGSQHSLSMHTSKASPTTTMCLDRLPTHCTKTFTTWNTDGVKGQVFNHMIVQSYWRLGIWTQYLLSKRPPHESIKFIPHDDKEHGDVVAFAHPISVQIHPSAHLVTWKSQVITNI